MSDGIRLDAWLVPTATLSDRPGLVLVHGFGGNKDHMRTLCQIFAAPVEPFNYHAIAYSVRGQGNSEGCSTVSGERERQDLYEVIQFFRSLPLVDENNIGVVGGSQGGIHSWMAAVDGIPGVKAVAPLVATPDFARALISNGCIWHGLPRELNIGSVNYCPERENVREFIIAGQYDSVLAYIEARDLSRLIDNIQIPVFQGLSWADYLFPVNGGIDARARLAARNIPIWSYFGTNGHGELDPLDTLQAAFVAGKLISWFDHWLKGSSLDPTPMVFYADDRPSWPIHTTTTWPPHAYRLRLYITRDGLSQSPPSDSATLPFSLLYDSSYTPAMAWDDLYGGSAFMSAFTSTTSRLMSDVLERDIEVTGIPSGRIFVQSDASKFQTHVRFYDVTPVDTGRIWRFMSRSVNGIRLNASGETHEIAIEGTALSHFVPAGHRIGVEITSLDTLRIGGTLHSNTVPYFLSSQSRLLSSPSSASYIEIPVDISVAVAEKHPTIPEDYVLLQNYPNPFNPSTTIEFSLPRASNVTLKVFNVLGEVVATLVNEELNVGTYTTQWNATSATSGVYFYRLQARDFVETKKLLLLK
jgi:predicted acyl esterase